MDKTIEILKTVDWGVVVGAIALLFAALTLQVQRKHNRLSVRPIAITKVGDFINRVAVYLQNKGTGPLIVNKLVFIDESGKEANAIIEHFRTRPGFEDIIWDTYVDDISGWAILPDDTLTLIELAGNPTDPVFISHRDKVREVLASVKVKLRYQDIYGKDMPEKEIELDYFAR